MLQSAEWQVSSQRRHGGAEDNRCINIVLLLHTKLGLPVIKPAC